MVKLSGTVQPRMSGVAILMTSESTLATQSSFPRRHSSRLLCEECWNGLKCFHSSLLVLRRLPSLPSNEDHAGLRPAVRPLFFWSFAPFGLGAGFRPELIP